MNDESRFCTACGASLPEGSMFCPECGRSVSGSENPYAQGPRPQMGGGPVGAPPPGKSAIPMLVLIYGVIGVIMGAVFLNDGLAMTEDLYNGMLEELSGIMGVDAFAIMPAWTSTMQLQMIVSGAFLTVSAVCALVCYIFCWVNQWRYALWFCVLADILVLGFCAYPYFAIYAIPLFLIGLFVTFRMYNERFRQPMV